MTINQAGGICCSGGRCDRPEQDPGTGRYQEFKTRFWPPMGSYPALNPRKNWVSNLYGTGIVDLYSLR
ncbi:hypothetical protein [Laspinema olomoucense]|uniref:Uncharacterized protein n=1 Tax=Laspinema olomoucense D3b TaxID=2953688 RepID=A0ABT2NBP8_9CYAN|nr:hypothetical protein [Laspinema sp. D3b]MCT7980119.1 hypothetical protein [Laspinema sp. D3b]